MKNNETNGNGRHDFNQGVALTAVIMNKFGRECRRCRKKIVRGEAHPLVLIQEVAEKLKIRYEERAFPGFPQGISQESMDIALAILKKLVASGEVQAL